MSTSVLGLQTDVKEALDGLLSAFAHPSFGGAMAWLHHAQAEINQYSGLLKVAAVVAGSVNPAAGAAIGAVVNDAAIASAAATAVEAAVAPLAQIQ